MRIFFDGGFPASHFHVATAAAAKEISLCHHKWYYYGAILRLNVCIILPWLRKGSGTASERNFPKLHGSCFMQNIRNFSLGGCDGAQLSFPFHDPGKLYRNDILTFRRQNFFNSAFGFFTQQHSTTFKNQQKQHTRGAFELASCCLNSVLIT